MVKLGDVSPTVWDEVVEKMEVALKDIEFQGDDILFDWRKPADTRRLERELFEKYGIFKDIILHPKFQYCKQLWDDNVNFDPVLGDPLMPFATAVIVLYMLHKRVSNGIIALAAAFIFNVNPFYVCLAYIMWWFAGKNRKPKNFRQLRRDIVPKDVSTYVPQVITEKNNPASSSSGFDHVLVGSDLSTLYTAALLSRNGHKCCVLQPKGAPAVEVQPEGAPFAIPVRNPTVGKADRYQSLLDTVQDINRKERVSFVPLGSEQDGYTHTVLRINASNSNSANTQSKSTSASAASRQAAMGGVWCLRVGENSLATDVSAKFHADRNALGGLLKTISAAQSATTAYLISKTAVHTSSAPATTATAAAASASSGDDAAAVATATASEGVAATTTTVAPGTSSLWSGNAADSAVNKAEGMASLMNLCTASVEQ